MPIRHHGFLASASKSIILRLAHAPHDPSSLSFHARNTSSEAYRQRIAVIGGGITGLTAAYCLSKRQDISVTLYEGSDRLGGWIQSKHVDVPGGRVLFELGPRTLRPGMPNGVLTAGLVCDDTKASCVGNDIFTVHRPKSLVSQTTWSSPPKTVSPYEEDGYTILTISFKCLMLALGFGITFGPSLPNQSFEDSSLQLLETFSNPKEGKAEAMTSLSVLSYHVVLVVRLWKI